jgi:oxygen-independent coproporphyrinogen-3 oxidase
MTSMLEAPPLALYVHFPWCVRKCPYCDFNSHAVKTPIPERQYVELLLRDFETHSNRVGGRSLGSIFLGGGTPSLFSPDALHLLLAGIRQRAAVEPGAEITLEANPGTIERGRFSDYRAAGISRVSLGAQSFNAKHLARLGRIHSAEETRRAVDELAAADLDNFNLDLMYGLPDQSVAEAVADLEAALALEPAHLSHYQLTLEPGTAFFHAPPALPQDDETWEMLVECQALLASRGFAQYEVSAYSRPGCESRHNLNYWEFGDYIGVGAGAHGKLTLADPRRIIRTERLRSPREYMAGVERAAGATESQIDPGELPFEFMLNALRLKAGFTRRIYESRTGLSLDALSDSLQRAQEQGLLCGAAADGWRCTDLGYRFLNNLLERFLSGRPSALPESYTQLRTMEPAAERCE